MPRLLVPIYRLIGGFPITQATALSLATISGGSIANLYTYTQRYHPNPQLRRPLIDYDTSLLFCPALLAGTMFGSMFSVMRGGRAEIRGGTPPRRRRDDAAMMPRRRRDSFAMMLR